MADNHTLSRPYAEAIFDVANEAKDLANWSKALVAAKDLLRDGQVTMFLSNPRLTAEQKFTFLSDLLNTVAGTSSVFSSGHKQGSNFLKLLLEYGRVAVLPEIAEHFDELKARAENTLEVTVTSAAPLSSGEQKAISTALKERFGREIHLQTDIDDTLIGGAVIRAGDVVIDGSLRSRLESLANALIA